MQHQYAFGYGMGSMGPWCASYSAFKDQQTYGRSSQQPAVPLSSPPFLTEAQGRLAETEQSAVDHADSQANYNTKVVLDFAEKHRVVRVCRSGSAAR
jgi:hypothetical protein